MVGHTSEQVLRGKKRLEKLLAPYKNTELFTAQDADEAARFVADFVAGFRDGRFEQVELFLLFHAAPLPSPFSLVAESI